MSTDVTLACAAGCGATQSAQTHQGAANRGKPLQVHPYICLDCWRAGWRHEAPKQDGQQWRIYQLEGRPQK